MYPIPDYMFALKLLSKGIPCHSKRFLIAARGALIMKRFLLKMSKGYCVEKLDKIKFGHQVFLIQQNIQILGSKLRFLYSGLAQSRKNN